MRLLVSLNTEQDVSFDVIVISPYEFCTNAGQLFTISHDFDSCVVELSDKMQLGFLNKLRERMIVIPKIVDGVNSHTISLLTELYPEKSAEMRYALIRNPESINDIINSLSETFKWKSFY